LKKLKCGFKYVKNSFLLMGEESKKVFFSVALIIIIFSLNIDLASAGGKPTFDEAWKSLMKEYRVIIASISGIGALTSVLVFIFHFVKLGSMPSHPIQRREVLNNMLISAVTTALLGGITLVMTIFYYTVLNPTS